MMNKNKTLEYYNKNADNFAKTTIDVNFYETQKHFQELLPEHGYILDFGCGSGRDTKYFLEQGFYVDATDGSEEMCYTASNYTGYKSEGCYLKSLMGTKNMMAYGPARQYFIFLRMNLKPFL